MKILFYTPFDYRARDVESVMVALQQRGHTVASLCSGTGAGFHDFLRSKNITTYVTGDERVQGIFGIPVRLWRFISFCWRFKPNVVISHLETCNFVAVVGQYFISAKVVIVRHHVEEAAIRGFDKSFSYRFTYRFGRSILAVSQRAVDYMIEHEGVNPEKIKKIYLAYDFQSYPTVNSQFVDNLSQQLNAKIVLLSVGRFTHSKRLEESLRVLSECLARGLDASLVVLGRGEDESKIRKLADKLSLGARIKFPGYVCNVHDYLATATFLIHPSISESSCVIVKEAAYVRTPVVVCSGVGDFDEYIKHNTNGFVVPPESFVKDTADIIQQTWQHRNLLNNLTENLYEVVLSRFSIETIIEDYGEVLVQ